MSRFQVPNGKFVLVECDLTSFQSVRGAAGQIKQKYASGINVLCCNAG
jgi:NAD(P)-dependent dehydrogenase (short-subunit alcohol dehydrogenase family)